MVATKEDSVFHSTKNRFEAKQSAKSNQHFFNLINRKKNFLYDLKNSVRLEYWRNSSPK